MWGLYADKLDSINSELSSAEKISASQLSRFVNGKSTPSESRRKAIVKYLGEAAGACYDWHTFSKELRKLLQGKDVEIEQLKRERFNPRRYWGWMDGVIMLSVAIAIVALAFVKPAFERATLKRYGYHLERVELLLQKNQEYKELLEAYDIIIDDLEEDVKIMKARTDILGDTQ